ncbi:hypothetical protein EDC96DRAFT_580471 [Choanephora cucurbitarum]|nr:hypothetical protein EDC96DRAFT_580471 [Choanephora cucurbitarum]
MKWTCIPFLLGLVVAYTELKNVELKEDVMESAELSSGDLLGQDYYSAVAIAEFTGPNIIGEFHFVQDSTGDTVATGAFQKGLSPGQHYLFKFYDGPNCKKLGKVVVEHDFENLLGLSTGGTVPIQEKLDLVHLTGTDGVMGLPWVLSDGRRDLACVRLKKNSN